MSDTASISKKKKRKKPAKEPEETVEEAPKKKKKKKSEVVAKPASTKAKKKKSKSAKSKKPKKKAKPQKNPPASQTADGVKNCFHCNQPGHKARKCPTKKNICFNCGSTLHSIQKCPEDLINGGFTYATCFRCRETGHMGAQCPSLPEGDRKEPSVGNKKRVQSKRAQKRAERRKVQEATYQSTGATCWRCYQPGHSHKNCPNPAVDKEKLRLEKDSAVICLRCRQTGHRASACPRDTAAQGAGGDPKKKPSAKAICYNCGSDKHSVHLCTESKKRGGFSFASCFVCGKQGHLSSKCPDSSKGIFPKGGSCFVCGEISHLAVNCPQNKGQDQSRGHKRTRRELPQRKSIPIIDIDGLEPDFSM